MKTKEYFIANQLNTEVITPLQWRGITLAMENYAKEYYAEQLRLGGVSNRRKLLIDLIRYAQTSMLKSDKIRTPDEVLNDFQSNL